MFKDCVTLFSIRSILSTKCCFLVLRLCEAVGVYLWPQIAPITHFDFEPGPRSSEQSGPPHCIVRLINLQRAQSSFGSSPTPPSPPSPPPPHGWDFCLTRLFCVVVMDWGISAEGAIKRPLHSHTLSTSHVKSKEKHAHFEEPLNTLLLTLSNTLSPSHVKCSEKLDYEKHAHFEERLIFLLQTEMVVISVKFWF